MELSKVMPAEEWIALINSSTGAIPACCQNTKALRESVLSIVQSGQLEKTQCNRVLQFFQDCHLTGHDLTHPTVQKLLKALEELAETPLVDVKHTSTGHDSSLSWQPSVSLDIIGSYEQWADVLHRDGELLPACCANISKLRDALGVIALDGHLNSLNAKTLVWQLIAVLDGHELEDEFFTNLQVELEKIIGITLAELDKS